ncbi:MAG TPA: cellulase family glycosylhydrolase [Candidatus Saccharimonadales bacterium]|nr:cellulase family glycosylhydrolase [Candidatus Saccharimonadales bacterium]
MYRDRLRMPTPPKPPKRWRLAHLRAIFLIALALLGIGSGLVWREATVTDGSLVPLTIASHGISADSIVLPGPALTAKSAPSGSRAAASGSNTPVGIPTITVASVGQDYGIAAGSSLTGMSNQQLNSEFSGMAALGVKWVRFDFDWGLIQPSNDHTYNWAVYDNLVTAARTHGLQVLGIIDYTPPWARPGCNSAQCPPSNPAQFATYAAAIAQRYKGQGLHYWEVWNEPNNPQFWVPGANAATYTSLLKQAYVSLHAADSQALVITAGLSPAATTSTSYAPIDFLTAVYNNGGKGYFDAVADHPYTYPLLPSTNQNHAWNQMASPARSLHQLMVSNGDADKKIWITEFGAPTSGPDPYYQVSEAGEAQMVSDAINLYKSYTWVGPFFWYSYQDSGTDTSTNENFFGLVRYDGSQKPAYQTFKQLIGS